VDYKNRGFSARIDREIRRTQSDVSDTGQRALRPVGSASSAFNVKPSASPGGGHGSSRWLTLTDSSWVTGASGIRVRIAVPRSAAARSRPTSPPASTSSRTPALPGKALPSEGPPWFYACVLYDGATEQLNELIHSNLFELDEHTSDKVLLTYIGNPREVGPVYDHMRDDRVREKDEEDARTFQAEQETGVGADYIRRREVHELISRTGIERDQLPCIAFFTRPQWTPPAVFKIRTEWLADEIARLELGRALIDFFKSDTIERLVDECRTNEDLTRGLQQAINDYMVGHLGRGRREASPCAPVLVLDEIRGGEPNRTLLAHIVGSGHLEGIDKRIGSRQLFFIYLLFKSNREHMVNGERMTVITLKEATEELLKWRNFGYLQFAGQDEGEPAYRVQKMWREFVLQIEKNKKLKGLFTNAHKDRDGGRLFALRLQPGEKQILVPNVEALFPKATS